ncbi:MAG TPA: MATE family efflux transporter [Burkholderiaceae bacterium]|mgnify:CR=1 FL=1|nr:MATE family efflux transporter [Burkholderiaceae bacterium]
MSIAIAPSVSPPPRSAVLRKIMALAAPTALVALLQVAAQLAEIWLAARQGVAAFAGWAVVLPFAQLMQQMSGGAMGGGVSSSIARALGANRPDEASALVVHALLIALAASAVFVVALAVFPYAVLGAIAGPDVAQAAASYSIWLFGGGAVPVWLTNTFASVLRGGGRHGLAARLLTLAWVVFPVLAWGFVELADFGLAGIGVAFALVFWIVALAMGVVVFRGGAGFVPRWRVRLAAELFRRILSVGLVACLIALLFNVANILVMAQIASYGSSAVAAYGIAARLEFLMIPLIFGVGSALTTLVGQTVGAGDWRAARRTAWTGALFAFGVASIAGLAVALAPAVFAGLFTSDPGVEAIAARALSFISPAFGIFGLGLALYFAAMGAGRMGWSIAASVARVVLAVGGGWLLANPGGMGLDGHFLGVALGIAALGGVNAVGVRAATWSAARFRS